MTRTVITGAKIFTADGAGSWSHAIAVDGDRIVALGDAALARTDGADTVIDARGRLVVPGFQDAHVHAPFAGNDLRHVWLNDTEATADAYLAAVADYARAHPDEEWIVGGGWYMEAFPGGTPHRDLLDAVVPDRPVFLMNRDVHGAWANSKALELAGLDRSTPDPADGRYERDADGELTGCLHEGAAYAFRDTVAPTPTVDDWVDGILTAQTYLHSLGITGWQDAWVTPQTLQAYRRLAADGRLTARVVGAQWWERSEGLEQIDRFVAQRDLGAPGFDPSRVKIMVDGVLENHTGSLQEPYCDGCGGYLMSADGPNRGLTYVDPEILKRAVTELDRLGFSVHMHAIGDAAVRRCLDAVEAARLDHGYRDTRHHIAHVQLVHPDDVPRFQQLGVTVNAQALWACNDRQMTQLTLPYLGAERSGWQYPFGSLAAAGATLAMGSDWPVSTPDPLAQIEVAVNRKDPGDRDAAPLLPHEALTLSGALRAFTAGSAHINGDDDAGRLAVGRRADLAVLDRDIFTDPTRVADAHVTLTMASGRVVHTAPA
ncbi:amidohydrolase [Flexivirga oryzae]|uniref:Amidohydrolase 3 domain-containing protein n=1 Tax=Flexivirga oryzae TaxID=1794944 RepID=A0A839NC11_9MICO|nr:amidohydrolase [Flexivirga oryzae]MBB2893793.1 hypothetical protein [Flexivirga oryzae]